MVGTRYLSSKLPMIYYPIGLYKFMCFRVSPPTFWEVYFPTRHKLPKENPKDFSRVYFTVLL